MEQGRAHVPPVFVSRIMSRNAPVPEPRQPGPMSGFDRLNVSRVTGRPTTLFEETLAFMSIRDRAGALEASGGAGSIVAAGWRFEPAGCQRLTGGGPVVADSQEMYTSFNIRGPRIGLKPFNTVPFRLSQNQLRRNRPDAPLCATKCANKCAEIQASETLYTLLH